MGRIDDVRDVGDSKPYGAKFSYKDTNLTYIRSGLCTTSQEMQPFEDTFNKFSKELRKVIHIKNMNPDEIVSKQLQINIQLKEAHNTLFMCKKPEKVLEQYKQLSKLNEQKRELNLEGVLFDNFTLEQAIGLTVSEKSIQNPNYYQKFLEKSNLEWFNFIDESDEKDLKVSQITYAIDFNSNSWQYNLPQIIKEITSKEETENPFIAAYLMQNLSNERKAIYSKEVIELLDI